MTTLGPSRTFIQWEDGDLPHEHALRILLRELDEIEQRKATIDAAREATRSELSQIVAEA